MVAFQPDLEHVREYAIASHLFRWQVAVIVEYRLVFGVPRVQFSSRVVLQHEIVVDKRHYLEYRIRFCEVQSQYLHSIT